MKRFLIICCLLFSSLSFGVNTLRDDVVKKVTKTLQGHPLHLAAFQNDLATVKSLVEAGTDVNVKASVAGPFEKLFAEALSFTPLQFATGNRNFEIIEYLFDKTEVSEEIMQTLVTFSVYTEDVDLLQFFVDKGANLNIKVPDGYAVDLAASTSNKELIQVFLDQEFDIDSKNYYGMTLLLASLAGGPHSSPLSNEFLKSLAKIWIDIDDSFMREKQEEAFKFFVDNGAKIDVKDDKGNTPLHHASYSKLSGVVKNLIERKQSDADKKAYVNAKNEKGETPLHFSVINPDSLVTLILIKAGVDVNAKNEKGETPLHLILNSNIAQTLIEAGADVNAENKYKITPLFNAVQENHLELAQTLIKAGANVNVKASYGDTVLDIALEQSEKKEDKDYTAIIELLKEHGAEESSVLQRLWNGIF